MRVVVTGARGKVGRAAVRALQESDHEVLATDLERPVFERDLPGAAPYVQADLTDQGSCHALVRDADAVVHTAAIPDPLHHPPHVVFHNNLQSTFCLVEAAVRAGVGRFVSLSSETVPGFFFPERPWLPDYAPVDEEHPVRPQDPYALAKHFGEQLLDAAVRRSEMRCLSLRSSWVQTVGTYERNLGPQVRDAGVLSASLWSYVDVDDLADAVRLAVESDLPDHEVLYVAAPDNAGGHDFAAALREHYGDRIPLRGPLERVDASGISSAKARRLLGWEARRSWRDHLDAQGRSRQRLP